MATLIACAPWEPPRTSTLAKLRSSTFEVRSSRSGEELRAYRIARDEPPLPKIRSVCSYVTAAARTQCASSRFVKPGTAFCSSTIVGIPRSAAMSTTGSRAVAADANHDVRPAAREQPPRVEQRLSGRSTAPRERAIRSTCPSAPRSESRPARSPRPARPALRARGWSPRTTPAHAGHAALNLPRHGNARKQMPARAAAGNHDRQPGHIRDLSIPRIRDVPSLARLDRGGRRRRRLLRDVQQNAHRRPG